MPRYKALAALAFIGVLISAGSVGSQDPYLARSEAESAATAIPVPYNPKATYAVPAEPAATGAPRMIRPAGGSVPTPTAPAAKHESPSDEPQIESAVEKAAVKVAMSHQTQMRMDGIMLDQLPAMGMASAPTAKAETASRTETGSKTVSASKDDLARAIALARASRLAAADAVAVVQPVTPTVARPIASLASKQIASLAAKPIASQIAKPAAPPVAKPKTVESGALKLTPATAAEETKALDFEDGATRSDAAERRLLATVPDEIESYFDLFMYVSKSTRGPLAQRMFVFQRDVDGKIIPYAEWRVSTGREKLELHHERKVRTTTPEGMFVLDPKRFYARYWSRNWDNAAMHHAMFYDLKVNGRASGLAIHAAVGDEKIRMLGRRDSAGCIRLSPKNAKELFYKIRNTTQGQVPAFAINENGSTDRWGRVQHDETTGALMLQDGYRAVLFVENFDGREEVLAPVIAYTN